MFPSELAKPPSAGPHPFAPSPDTFSFSTSYQGKISAYDKLYHKRKLVGFAIILLPFGCFSNVQTSTVRRCPAQDLTSSFSFSSHPFSRAFTLKYLQKKWDLCHGLDKHGSRISLPSLLVSLFLCLNMFSSLHQSLRNPIRNLHGSFLPSSDGQTSQ